MARSRGCPAASHPETPPQSAASSAVPTNDTIAAIATPAGRGGIGIVRISGAATRQITTSITGRDTLTPRLATHCHFNNPKTGEVIDDGIALYFPAPNSFTGEDVLELQGHGGPVVMDMLMQAVLACGARAARPGEFSERAFLNDKLDLTQAEAIADLIDSGSRQAALGAVQSLQGVFSEHVHALVEQLTQLRIHVEAAIDFPEEEIDFLQDKVIADGLQQIIAALQQTLDNAYQGKLLQEGMRVVIAGKPNAGKSSLLNALAQFDAAIVTDIAGTTRDLLRESIHIDGMPLHVVDTAGLRDSDDVIEQEGIRRALREIENADRLLLVIDASTETDIDSAIEALTTRWQFNTSRCSIVVNKTDLADKPFTDIDTRIHVSAHTGDGIDALREHLKTCMGFEEQAETGFSARRRHVDALTNALQHVTEGQQQLQHHSAGELLAEELRLAQQALSEITGDITSDELLGKIFSSFCIGK